MFFLRNMLDVKKRMIEIFCCYNLYFGLFDWLLFDKIIFLIWVGCVIGNVVGYFVVFLLFR